MTLEGAQRAMRKRGKSDVSRSAELMERLQSVKSMLLEMREMLGEEAAQEIVIDDEPAAAEPVPAVAETFAETEAETEVESEAPQSESAVTVIEPGRSQRLEEQKAEKKSEKAVKPETAKPELPFYEQTLF